MHRRIGLSTFSILALVGVLGWGVVGCENGDDNNDTFECRGGRCDDGHSDTSFNHRWAIDMEKVRNLPDLYGKYESSVRFVAAHPQELGLDIAALPPELQPIACQREYIVANGTATPGECLLWGNMMRRNWNHTYHIDQPVESPIINIIDNGNQIDPPGYLNIIALLNADVQDQNEILSKLQNGDILVYFHPEDDDTTQLRMHHAAMYYESQEGPLGLRLDGDNYAHHIDNPESYGPALNAGVSSVPFHVYRFNPNGAPNVGGRDGEGDFQFTSPTGQTFTITDQMADQYAYMSRNWALLTNDHAPFSSFHVMSWNDAGQRDLAGLSLMDEIDRYAGPAVTQGQIPQVYCAGLVYTNVNLALNRPMNQAAMGPHWSAFSSTTYDFDDGYFQADLTFEDLQDEMNLPSLNRLLIEPIPASEIIDGWLETYIPAPVDPTTGEAIPQAEAGLRQLRSQILSGGADRLAQGFRSLVWAATKDPENAEENTVVATPDRLRAYAMVYAQPLGADNLTVTIAPGGDLTVTPGSNGAPDMDEMKALELQYVDNRYVPPPQYHVLANRAESLISYVGTVIHVDLLAPIGDNNGENTGSGVISEFREGGPDSSLYEHYFITNGGRHTQRILQVASGPEDVGHGSRFSTRISASDINDVRVILHPAGSFPAFDSRYACEREPMCMGDTPAGVYVPVSADLNGGATAWTDVNVSFDFFAPVDQGGLGCVLTADGAECPAYDWATGGPSADQVINIGGAYGQWTITVLDLGDLTEGQTLNAGCIECPNGGAHSNQWVIVIRNDAE